MVRSPRWGADGPPCLRGRAQRCVRRCEPWDRPAVEPCDLRHLHPLPQDPMARRSPSFGLRVQWRRQSYHHHPSDRPADSLCCGPSPARRRRRATLPRNKSTGLGKRSLADLLTAASDRSSGVVWRVWVEVTIDEEQGAPLHVFLQQNGAVAKRLGNGLQNHHTWVRIPSAPQADPERSAR